MSRSLFSAVALVALAAAQPAFAAPPKVVASVAPVDSLVESVMGDLGDPYLLVGAGQSPHTYSMRPSDAAALEDADLVVWVGPALETFLEKPVSSISKSDATLELQTLDGIEKLKTRSGGVWGEGGHDHGHGHEHADEHAHEGGDSAEGEHGHSDGDHDHDHGHEEHAHSEQASAEGHDHDHDHSGENAGNGEAQGHEHAEGSLDPHLWLDPDNAIVMTRAIADRLAKLDPDNASTYRDNAEKAISAIQSKDEEISQQLEPVSDKPYFVFHDAYHYFEKHYGLHASGAIKLSPSRQPSPARIAEIRDRIESADVHCVFREPQFEPDLVNTVIEDTDAQEAVLDPLGIGSDGKPLPYQQLLGEIADNLTGCLEGHS